MRRRVGALVVAIGMAASACTSDEAPEVETTEVVSAEVVQTVAAAAELQPASRVTVNAPAGGEVAELLVGDGDVVSAGDPVVRLASDTIDQQVAQAEAAVDAAESLGASATAGGLDLSPVLGSFRSQLDAVFPPVIAALTDQIDALESATEALATLDPPPPPAARTDVAAGEAQGAHDTGHTSSGAEPEEDTGRTSNGAEPEEDAGHASEDTPPTDAPAPPNPPPTTNADVLDEDAIADALGRARSRVSDIEAGYLEARASLDAAERDARRQTAAAVAGQQAAADAQVEQALVALQAARARVEDLTVVAPESGVVELARAGTGGLGDVAPSELPEGDTVAEVGELGAMLGTGADGASRTGPLAEGVGVAPGQPLLTIFDLTGFTARVLVDELDIVEVETGQSAIVLVDAFPDAELAGRVGYVAIEPERRPAGAAVYPVTVTLDEVPSDVALRVGLTASSEIETRRVQADTVVPTSALLRRDTDEVVHVVRDGVARRVPVRILALGEETAAVDGDLAVGERVVSRGLEVVEDGTPVPHR